MESQAVLSSERLFPYTRCLPWAGSAGSLRLSFLICVVGERMKRAEECALGFAWRLVCVSAQWLLAGITVTMIGLFVLIDRESGK